MTIRFISTKVEDTPIYTGGPISITVDRSTLMCAPDSARFGVDLSEATFDTPEPLSTELFDQRLHDLVFIWDTGDSGTWDAPQNVLPQWNDKSCAKGPWIAHCYTRPDNYTVSVLVIEPSTGKSSQATVNIQVNDPDVVYAGSKTICINPPGDTDFTNAPAGSEHVTLTGLNTFVNDEPWWDQYIGETERRFLFKAGATYPDEIAFNYNITTVTSPSPHPMFDTYGDGMVTLKMPSNDLNQGRIFSVGAKYDGYQARSASDFRLQNIIGVGTYDPTTELRFDPSATDDASGLFRTNKYLDFVAHNCQSIGGKNSSFGFYHDEGGDRNTTFAGHSHMDNVTVTDFGGEYAVFASPTDRMPDGSFTMTGCALRQNVSAITPANVDRAPVRTNGDHNTHVRCSESYTNEHANPAWKLCTTPYAEIGHVINVEGIYAEGGDWAVQIQQNVTRGIAKSTVVNCIIDGAILVAALTNAGIFESRATGVTLRNILAIIPNSPAFANDYFLEPDYNMNDEEASAVDGNSSHNYKYSTRAVESGFSFRWYDGSTPSAGTLDQRVSVTNSTLVMERPNNENLNRSLLAVRVGEGLTNVVDENNIIIGPWLDAPADQTIYDPLDQTVLFAPYTKGFRGRATPTILRTEFATPLDAIKSYAPKEGSEALGAALNGATAYFDISGRQRPVYPSIGAWEML